MTTQDFSAWAPLIISASRLTVLGGEKGNPGCERRYIGQYLKGLKQAETSALIRGSALHRAAEHLQATGEVQDPEGDIGTLLRSGSHLLETCGKLLVEYEHRGLLPDGTPYVAYLDGHSADGGTNTYCIVIQDLKTTSNPQYALVPGSSAMGLKKNIQAMLYAWVMLCNVHWYAAPLGDGEYGPQQWKIWDPAERNARHGRLRWLYFLTRGNARAWDSSDHVEPGDAASFMADTILPLVARIRALHSYHDANPGCTLETFDRNFGACKQRGDWCGVGERDLCQFEALGTPILDLVQLRVRPQMTAQQRLAALKPQAATTPKETPSMSQSPAEIAKARMAALQARMGTKPAPLQVTPAPAPEAAAGSPPAQPAAPVSEVTAPAQTNEQQSVAGAATSEAPAEIAHASAEPKRGRGRPPKPPAALTGAGINPPEGAEALAKLTAEGPSAPAPVVAPTGLAAFPSDVLLGEVLRRALATQKALGL